MDRSFKVLFRTDGRRSVGLGHLVRCIALAEAFEALGAACRFAGSAPAFLVPQIPGGPPLPVPGGLADWNDAGFAAAARDSDLLVTDLYAIGADWQARSPVPVLAIADPPLAALRCNLLVLPTVFDAPNGVEALCGPRHSLIRSDVARRRSAPKSGERVLVSCGGGDERGLTARVLRALAFDAKLAGLQITVVTGVMPAPHLAEIVDAGSRLPNANLHERVADMAALIDGHDMAVGTPAGAALERCCLGLAQVLIPIAANQAALGEALDAAGAALVLPGEAGEADIAAALRGLLDHHRRRAAMAEAAFGLIDGGGARRVAQAALARFGRA